MNNLRRDVHAAFEGIEPSLGGMPERMVQTVLAEKNGRLRKERMTYRLRVSFALVAAVLLVAVGAAAIITWNGLHNNTAPAGGVHLSSLQQLEARPFTVPAMQSGDACVEGPFDSRGYYGQGPVYGIGGNPITNSWGEQWNIAFSINNHVKGYVLIRGRDLKTGQPVLWSGQYAYGPVVDQEATRNFYGEIVVNMDSTSAAAETRFPITSALRTGHGDCVGVQMDGSNFTETFRGGA